MQACFGFSNISGELGEASFELGLQLEPQLDLKGESPGRAPAVCSKARIAFEMRVRVSSARGDQESLSFERGSAKVGIVVLWGGVLKPQP